MGLTKRLYYSDSYLTTFAARVVDARDDGRCVYLDRTEFYPSSGGQPCDYGTLGGARVLDVVDEGERIAHVLETAVTGEVEGRVDWTRRFDHMQQHTGQHLLSAVWIEQFGIATVSFHMGSEVSTIELAAPALTPAQLVRVEERVNELVAMNRAVRIGIEQEAQGLRKASAREGPLRIVEIEGLDRSACGGTHVRATGEIGVVLMRGQEKIRGNTRVEFVCGLRAARRARRDYDALAGVARLHSAGVDDVAACAAAGVERLQEAEKARRKLATEVAVVRGERLYAQTEPGADGMRRHLHRGALGDEVRAEAQAFTAGSRSMYVAVDGGAVLIAVSADSGVHAGEMLKALLAKHGGRGGGSARLAQGSVADAGAIETVLAELVQLS